MSSRFCRAELKHPTSGNISGVELKTEADPCPLRRGRMSTHTTLVDNGKPVHSGRVWVSVKSVYGVVLVNGKPGEEVKFIPFLPSGKSHTFSATLLTAQGSTDPADEIETIVIMYDPGTTPTNPKSGTLKYAISIV